MIEIRSYTPEHGLWIGKNIQIAKHVIVLPNSPVEIPVLLNPDGFPPKKDWHLGKTFPLKVSVRSRFAQGGLDIDDETGNALLAQILVHQNGNGLKPFEASVKVINRAARPMEILSETELFRLYAQKDPPLKGHALERMFIDKKIEIAGKKGVDWEWALDVDGKTPIGVYIKINADNRRWIPSHPENEPLLIDDKAKDYREILDTYLQDVPLGSEDKILWIGETPRLTLKGVYGILDQVTHTHFDRDSSKGFGRQINSRLIDEDSDWPIRVEISSKTTWGKMPNFVRMQFI